MKNNKAPFFVVVVAVAGVLNLPAYSMDKGWLEKENIKLAGCLIGGVCVGIGGLALYQRVKHSGMRYITEGYADIAEHIQVFSSANRWDIVDKQTGKYDQNKVQNLLAFFDMRTDYRNIKTSEDEEAVRKIQSFMCGAKLKLDDVVPILQDVSALHSCFYIDLVRDSRSRRIDTFCDHVKSFRKTDYGMDLDVVEPLAELCYGQLNVESFCFREKIKDGLSRPVPVSVLAYVATKRLKYGMPYMGNITPDWGGDISSNSTEEQ